MCEDEKMKEMDKQDRDFLFNLALVVHVTIFCVLFAIEYRELPVMLVLFGLTSVVSFCCFVWLIVKEARRSARKNVLVSSSDIEGAPVVDAVPVMRGCWVIEKVIGATTTFSCSRCGRKVAVINNRHGKPAEHIAETYPYCHCGAKMDLKAK